MRSAWLIPDFKVLETLNKLGGVYYPQICLRGRRSSYTRLLRDSNCGAVVGVDDCLRSRLNEIPNLSKAPNESSELYFGRPVASLCVF